MCASMFTFVPLLYQANAVGVVLIAWATVVNSGQNGNPTIAEANPEPPY